MEEIITKGNLDTYTQGLKGVLSSMGEAILDNSALSSIEDKVDIIDLNVDDIEADTTTLKSDTTTIKADVSTIKTKTNTIDTKLDTISTAISNIGSGSSESSIIAAIGDYLYSDMTISSTLASNKTVIGRCVIPTGLLPDYKARFVSVNYLSSSNLDSGTSLRNSAWACDYFDSTLKKVGLLKHIVGIGNPAGINGMPISYDRIIYRFDWDNIPYLINELDENTGDITKTTFIISYDTCWAHINVHGGYGQTNGDMAEHNAISIGDPIEQIVVDQKSNFVSDIYGYNNCKQILKYLEYIGQTSWKTESVGSGSYFIDAVKRCWRFNPGNSNKGDWYIPSIGELYTTIENLGDGGSLGSYGIHMDYNQNYGTYTPSSTLFGDQYVWTVFRHNLAEYSAICYGNNSGYVKPFIAL